MARRASWAIPHGWPALPTTPREDLAGLIAATAQGAEILAQACPSAAFSLMADHY